MKESEKSLCESKVFEEVYKTHVTALRNYVYYKSGDIDVAEDIVQECFMKIWKNCAKIIFSTVKSLLYKMASNSFLNMVSHKKVVLEHQKLSVNNKNSTNENPEFLLEEKEFLKKLQNAIADLSDKEREVFLLNRIDKKKYREIAELLNISVKAVEKRMSSALKKLRTKIEGI
ncbi:RNA polymerase sigma factor [Tenacibaculum sp. M341]|uniref:RNA polymerase sigma factor n=1 Tax=Tenacibaculum sp. M341 TaxID=2530339 RepID=UPI001051589D|nr:sigma-70 family RNA polymerase sigma factor [Tenacibaculum sp. M341]TCI85863.1 sigma-70 family RNA polymerase sigma factor [Tenacibaculum sp. M341]